MSSFLLPVDHIHYLVDLGAALEITAVSNEHAHLSHRLDYSVDDCQFIAQHLIEANKASVAARATRDFSPTASPSRHPKPVSITSLRDLAQAIQWVRCYQYQACDALDWNDTFANHYTNQCQEQLVSRIIASHDTSWVYEGPAR